MKLLQMWERVDMSDVRILYGASARLLHSKLLRQHPIPQRPIISQMRKFLYFFINYLHDEG